LAPYAYPFLPEKKEPPVCWAALWLTFTAVLLASDPYGRQPNGKKVLKENPNKDDNKYEGAGEYHVICAG
jgi:hypothetical protein